MRFRRLAKKIIPKRLLRVVAPYGHLTEGILYNCIYGFPARGMIVIGVTGTNGKTTTSFLVHRMLQESGYKAGLITTAAWAIGDDMYPQKEHMTNVPMPLLMQRLRAMRAAGVEWLVLETTSHALSQYRTWGVPYSVGVLTNISHDHLDYHKTMERYIAAKRRLFTYVRRNKKGLQFGIVNADDRYASSFAGQARHTLTYGINDGDIRAENIRLDASGIAYDATTKTKPHTKCRIISYLPGGFNVYNTLAALCVGRAVGLTDEQIARGIASLAGVPGRMEPIHAGQQFAVIVDYAHTPAALENVLGSLRQSTEGNLAVVFGATGDRDRTKRGPMGAVAARLADKIYLTNDETYGESPDAIRMAVLQGIGTAGGTDKTQVVSDRLQAIRRAFAEAVAGDTVLLAGLGHQDYRMMGNRKQPWDDRTIARQALKDLPSERSPGE